MIMTAEFRKKGVGYVSEEGERNGDKVGEREKKEA